MRTMNVGVYALLPHLPGVNPSTSFSDEFVRWLFSANENLSLKRYWQEVSSGELDINATVTGFISIEGQSYIDRLRQTTRGPSANEAVAIVSELGYDPSLYDGLVFIIGGHGVDAGSTSVTFGGRTRPVCYFDDLGSHSFMAHELGHLLGHDHPFDTSLYNGIYKYGEYGDPTCIMSAENYGGFAATFVIPEALRVFADSDARFWQSAGPGVSMMTMFRYSSNFPATQPYSAELAAGAPPTPIRLNRAGSSGIQLITMPTTGSNSRYGVEYRPSIGWDRGLASPKAGVVIHEIRNKIGFTSDGAGWPKENGVCLVDVIPIPSAIDLDWNNGSLSVQIAGFNQEWVDVIVGAARVIEQVEIDETFISSSDAEQISVSRTKWDCGVHEYTAVRSTQSITIRAQGVAWGFHAPQYRHELNGVRLNAWTTPGTILTGITSIPVNVNVPATLTTHTSEIRNISISFVANGTSISITLPPGDGDYVVSLKCFVADNPSPETVGEPSGEVELLIKTASIHLPVQAVVDQGQCLARRIDELRQIPVWPREEEHPDWRIPEVYPDLRQIRVTERIRNVAEFRRRFPAVAKSDFSNLATELNVSEAELHTYAAQLTRQVMP